MDSAKAKAVKVGPVLPKPPVPKKVVESNAKPPVVEKSPPPVEKVEEKKEVKVVAEEKPKGTITIYMYHNKPYEAKFTGEVTGVEINIAWRAMYKQYKLWKRSLLKQGGK